MRLKDWARSRNGARAVGVTATVAFFVLVEALIRAGLVNQFIVPLPSQIIASIPRIIAEEHVLDRFLQTMQEVLWASVMIAVVGISIGVLFFKFRGLRLACESWVGAMAAAPIVLLYPLFLVIFGRSATTIVMIGFVAGLAPVILKTIEGLAGTRAVLLNVGRSFKVTPSQQFWKILLPAALPSVFVGLRLGLIFAMINIVGVEFLINFGGLGQLINELAERYDLPGTYGAICFVILTSMLFFDVTARIERWLRPVE
ncbi:MAG: ABC transporter permease subunit [Betaproteobacteria bacterium]|nr:ABC transporter permease subunit [Betaproteobacteria bacterium]